MKSWDLNAVPLSPHAPEIIESGDDGRAIVLAPRFWPRLWPDTAGRPQWGDTSLTLPTGSYRNILTDARLSIDGALPVGDLLGDFPVGLLIAED